MKVFSRSVCGLIAVAALVSCTPRPAERDYSFQVVVERDPGVPLAGIPVLLGDNTLGTTNLDGKVQIQLSGAEGGKAELLVACPAKHAAAPPMVAHLREYAANAIPELRTVCAPLTRSLAVVIRASKGGGLPIVHRSKNLGVTDADGVSHILLEGAPGDTFDVVLDTTANPLLRPQNPTASFTMPNADAIASYDTRFESKEPPKVRRRVRRKTPSGPVRIR